MAAVIRSSSMKLVMATTSIAGWRALISAVAAIPSSPGISRSITTTSGSERRRGLERAVAVGRLADDLEIVVQVEEIAHAAADHRVVVDDQDADRGGARHEPPGARTARGSESWPWPGSGVGSPRVGVSASSASIAGAATARPPGCRRALEDERGAEDREPAERPGSGPAARRAARAASATPTTGSNSIRIPARVPPMSRIPVRNRIDGMAAANSPVNASSGRIDGSRSG